jgi:hypothetical protein
MGGNDQYGDCVICAMGHAVQAVDLDVKEAAPTFPDSKFLSTYSMITGFTPTNPNSDQGTDPNQAFSMWMTQEFFGTKIDGVGVVPPANLGLVERAIDEFEVLFMSLALPNSCQGQRIWDVGPNVDGNYAPGSWGYHEVIALSYDDKRFAFIS